MKNIKETLLLAKLALKSEVCNGCSGKVVADWATDNCRNCLIYPALKRISKILRYM